MRREKTEAFLWRSTIGAIVLVSVVGIYILPRTLLLKSKMIQVRTTSLEVGDGKDGGRSVRSTNWKDREDKGLIFLTRSLVGSYFFCPMSTHSFMMRYVVQEKWPLGDRIGGKPATMWSSSQKRPLVLRLPSRPTSVSSLSSSVKAPVVGRFAHEDNAERLRECVRLS